MSMDLTQQGVRNGDEEEKANSKESASPAQSGSSLLSTMIGHVFNMVATTATSGFVLLFLIVAKRFA
jgi:hypothetical protein